MTSERLQSSVIFTSSYMSSRVCKFFAIMELLPGYALPALPAALVVSPGDGGVDAGDGIVGGVLALVLVDEEIGVEADEDDDDDDDDEDEQFELAAEGWD